MDVTPDEKAPTNPQDFQEYVSQADLEITSVSTPIHETPVIAGHCWPVSQTTGMSLTSSVASHMHVLHPAHVLLATPAAAASVAVLFSSLLQLQHFIVEGVGGKDLQIRHPQRSAARTQLQCTPPALLHTVLGTC